MAAKDKMSAQTDRAWLDAPCSEKDRVKATGAGWDVVAKRWYDPTSRTAGEGRARQRVLEAHERWNFDERTETQTLRSPICLRSPCHLVTHISSANITGRANEALAHLREAAGMTAEQAAQHLNAGRRLCLERSQRRWQLEYLMLTGAGITLCRPGTEDQRTNTADHVLADHQIGRDWSSDR